MPQPSKIISITGFMLSSHTAYNSAEAVCFQASAANQYAVNFALHKIGSILFGYAAAVQNTYFACNFLRKDFFILLRISTATSCASAAVAALPLPMAHKGS